MCEAGQPVAIKLIDMKNIKGEVHKTLLGNEMEILRLLSNLQNVIKLHDILPLKAHTCIVTELCDGGDLARTIKARKALPEKEATDILQQVIAGYRGIHRFGIVHRDLKPANIFFSEGKVKIADFGFAIRNADLKKSTNYNVGSPVYMPLEALNDNLYSAKSDVWAIGVIFFEMLTGRTPWKAKTEAELKKQIKSVPIRSLLPPSLSRTAADFLVRALQVNPALRMSPEEMGDFFEKAQEDPHSTTAGSSLRTNYLFRTRAMSQDREERVEQTDLLLPLPKNTVTAPKTFRKISRLAEGLPKAEGTNGFERESIGERVGEAKLGSLARTVAGLGGEWVPDHRKTSAQLLSQIHLCRFFYKLIERLEALGRGEEKLRKVMGAMIGGKLQEIRDLSHIPSGYATIFKRTK